MSMSSVLSVVGEICTQSCELLTYSKMSGRRDSTSSIESADSDVQLNLEGRRLNVAVVDWRDYHKNGR